jgi:hypothetical protein
MLRTSTEDPFGFIKFNLATLKAGALLLSRGHRNNEKIDADKTSRVPLSDIFSKFPQIVRALSKS